MSKAQEVLNLFESDDDTVTLFHGGRDLEHSYRDTISHSKGNWEYGPGLYLTTHYDVAIRYAKGGSKLYKVTVQKGTNIREVNIPYEAAKDFVLRNVIGSKRKDVLSDFQRNMERLKLTDRINADTFLNIIINDNAIKNTSSGILKDFLVKQGVDYSIVPHGLGNDKMLVLMNNSKIKNVEVVNRGKLKDDFVLPFNW